MRDGTKSVLITNSFAVFDSSCLMVEEIFTQSKKLEKFMFLMK